MKKGLFTENATPHHLSSICPSGKHACSPTDHGPPFTPFYQVGKERLVHYAGALQAWISKGRNIVPPSLSRQSWVVYKSRWISLVRSGGFQGGRGDNIC